MVETGSFFLTALRNGLWRGHLAGLSLHGVELREAYKTGPSERFLYLFTRAFLRNPQATHFMEGLDTEDLRLYDLLRQHVQQLRRDPATMHLKDIDIAEQNLAEARKKLIANTPIEDRLEGLTPEQVLARYSPEQIAAALPPEVLDYIARKAKR